MDIWTVILMLFWSIAGVWLIVGELPGMTKHRIDMIFGVTNRWGKILIGLVLLAFVAKQAHVAYLDPNVTLDVVLAPFKLHYEGFTWF
jgi:hypothetical protein